MTLRTGVLPILALFLMVAAQPASAEPPRSRLVFCCAPDNDLYRVLTAAGVTYPRHDRPTDAVRVAAEGSGVLILADGHPENL